MKQKQRSLVFVQYFKMCRLRVLNDSPMTMQEREFGGNYMTLHSQVYSLFNKTASEAEVLSMYINGAEPYRKKKAITKIFRRSKYIPRLEDIEERPENSEFEDLTNANELDLSLTCIHLERAMSAGIMAQESRRRRRRTSTPSRRHGSPRKERRTAHRSAGENVKV